MKHDNYEILNLLGYGLAKFDNDFIQQFGFKTKQAFFDYFVEIGIVETGSVVKNRMDLFDPFFDNGRKGWWQKGNAYIHRKQLIDSLFGNEDAVGFANVVKLFLKDKFQIENILIEAKPIFISRYKKLQQTGTEAEQYFLTNYEEIEAFKTGSVEDARLYGDGYDFQINVSNNSYLIEVKGIREAKGRFRLTEKEYLKAMEYKSDYIITIVLNLNENPNFLTVENPLQNLKFKEESRTPKSIKEYYLQSDIC